MKLSAMKPPRGARKVNRRAGRGESSGLGTTAGRGHKGQKSRAGKKVKSDFEGGQMPLLRRIPKFGFTNIFRRETAIVNLKDLERFDAGTVVDVPALKAEGLVRNRHGGPVKILGNGSLSKALTVKVTSFSKTAVSAIEKAGGKAETLAE